MRQPPRGVTRARFQQSIADSYGPQLLDLLRLAGRGRQTVAQASLRQFQARTTGLPEWQPILSAPIELGGRYENDLFLMIPVSLARSGQDWADYLGNVSSFSLDPWQLNVSYLVRRVFDVRASNELGEPVVRYQEALQVIARPPGEREGASVLLVGSDGVREIHAIDGPLTGIDTGPVADIVRRLPDRIAGLPSHVSGLDEQSGAQVFLPIEDTQAISAPSTPQAGAAFTARYERLLLGSPIGSVPPDLEMPDQEDTGIINQVLPTLGRPSDQVFRPPAHGDAGGGAHVGTVLVSGTTEVTTVVKEGNSGQTGFGPRGSAIWTYQGCAHYKDSDECKGCCHNQFAINMAALTTVAAACHTMSSVCLCCHLGCLVGEGVVLGAQVMMRDDCLGNCEVRVDW
jgi:hypothetical protein